MADTNIVFYDDTSQQIEYAGPWYPLTSLNSSTHNGTITGVNGPGAFSLTFFGSHVSVWGTLRGMNYTLPTPTESSYSIDGVINPNYTALQGTEEIDNVLFFDSGDIGTSIHKIIVTVISATPSFPYYLDYITVVSPTNSTSTTLSQITIISTTTLLQPATLSQIPVTYTASDIPSQSTVSSLRPNSTSSHVAVGAIVGGAVCGVVVLLCLIACVFLWRRRRDARIRKGMVDIDGTNEVVPFTSPREYYASPHPNHQYEGKTPLSVVGSPSFETGSLTGVQEELWYHDSNESLSDSRLMHVAERSNATQNDELHSLPSVYSDRRSIDVVAKKIANDSTVSSFAQPPTVYIPNRRCFFVV